MNKHRIFSLVFAFLSSILLVQSQQVRQIEITESVAIGIFNSWNASVSDVNIRFTPNEISISGFYDDSLFVVITGIPSVENDKLTITLTGLRIEEESIIDANLISNYQQAINDILVALQYDRHIVSAELSTGTLTLTYSLLDNVTEPTLNIQQSINSLFESAVPQCGVTQVPALPRGAMNATDQNLLDTAVSKVENAQSIRFRYSLTACAQDLDEQISIQITGRGIISNFTDFASLGFSQTMTFTTIYNGVQQQTLLIEYRIIDGTVYLTGSDPETGRSIQWIGVPLENLLDDIFLLSTLGGTDIFNPLYLGEELDIDLSDSGLATQILELGNFFNTQRTDVSAPIEAQYTTVVDITGMISSYDRVSGFINLLTDFGAFGSDDGNMTGMISDFLDVSTSILPRTNFVINRYVDIATEELTRIDLSSDLEVDLSIFDTNGDSIYTHFDAYIDVVALNQDNTIAIPENVYFVEDLDNIDPSTVLIEPSE